MTWAPTEVQKAVFGVLSADVTLQTLLSGTYTDKRVYDTVPDNTSFPYVVMDINPYKDRGNHTWEGLDFEFTIHTWGRSRGKLQVQSIQKRIDELLHSQDIIITGWNIVVLRRAMGDIIPDPDNITLHGVQKFKLYIGEV